ncbi:hypothetical protein CEUSTIGMA_g5505.t1 [Chlamydomonas eustigma]|uniref:C3H1-type domain-containing protein n=1 Tax=Chlamydomonas eustigma TaxID=1157962 RepID=A0A250X4Q9_9CHLO|nr:hypothetical protein CEUSTIGMA_g5505.t1 [Chlamydomonas eustigma]|eukprot:GAX78063.1 hypothetical protein CEUSTIGMA_g5505.t1 [Chlamydomonas eustigma]
MADWHTDLAQSLVSLSVSDTPISADASTVLKELSCKSDDSQEAKGDVQGSRDQLCDKESVLAMDINHKQEAAQPSTEAQRAKLQICFDFTKGMCSRGDRCKYSHDVATIVNFNSKEKGICFDYLRNQCQRGLLCRFSHDLSTITQQCQNFSGSETRGRTNAICYDFVKGVCQRGVDCRYSHDLSLIASSARGCDNMTRSGEICYDFIRGRCTRSAQCRFSHNLSLLSDGMLPPNSHNPAAAAAGRFSEPSGISAGHFPPLHSVPGNNLHPQHSNMMGAAFPPMFPGPSPAVPIRHKPQPEHSILPSDLIVESRRSMGGCGLSRSFTASSMCSNPPGVISHDIWSQHMRGDPNSSAMHSDAMQRQCNLALASLNLSQFTHQHQQLQHMHAGAGHTFSQTHDAANLSYMPPLPHPPNRQQQQQYAMMHNTQPDMHQSAAFEAAMQAAVMCQTQANFQQQHALIQQQRIAMMQQHCLAAAAASQQYNTGAFNLPTTQQMQAGAPPPLSSSSIPLKPQGGCNQGLIVPSDSLSFMLDDLNSGNKPRGSHGAPLPSRPQSHLQGFSSGPLLQDQAPKLQRLHSLPGSTPAESSPALTAICNTNSSVLSDGGAPSAAAAAFKTLTVSAAQQQCHPGVPQPSTLSSDLSAIKHAGLMPLLKEIWRKKLS